MKKLLLITITTVLFNIGYGQILSASTSAEFQTWSIVDLNNDGLNFQEVNWGTANPATFLNTLGEAIFSESYDAVNQVGITPDNLLVSPAMNFTSVSSSNISWKVAATDVDWPAEKYSVYLSTSPTSIATATQVFTETMVTGGQIFSRSTSSSAYAGQSAVYLIFRHHGCYDQFKLTLDDILLESAVACNLTASSSSTGISANGANDGTATATPANGTAPYTYSWAPAGAPNSTATSLAPGTYTCTITDANNCTATTSTTIGSSPCNLTTSITSTGETTPGANNGTATITATNGTSPYTYSWSPSGGNNATITNRPPGVYTCTVTDANNCTSSKSTTITAGTNCNLTATATTTNENAPGANNGSINITANNGTAPYSYYWYPNISTSSSASNLAPGSYVIDIVDGNGCTYTITKNIGHFTCNLSASTTSSDVTTVGGNNGTASVTAVQGKSPYTYLWSPGGSTSLFQNSLSKGTYTVNITDANNCVVSVTIIINDPGCSNLNATTTSTNETYYGANDGTAQVTATGGTTPYSYIWSPSGGNLATAVGLSPDVYSAIVIDDAGCSTTSIVTVKSGTPVSIEETSEESLVLKAFPNPTSDILNIELNETVNEISILNLNGQTLFTKAINSNNFSVSVNELSNGVYFYQIKTEKGNLIMNRFVKN